MKKIEGQEEITEKNDAQEIERAETEKKVKRTNCKIFMT